MEVRHDDGAQDEVEEEDDQAHQGGHSLPLSPLLGVLPPPAAEDLVVEVLQVVAQEPAHQHHVQQEYRQTDGGDADGEELAQSRARTPVGITWRGEITMQSISRNYPLRRVFRKSVINTLLIPGLLSIISLH